MASPAARARSNQCQHCPAHEAAGQRARAGPEVKDPLARDPDALDLHLLEELGREARTVLGVVVGRTAELAARSLGRERVPNPRGLRRGAHVLGVMLAPARHRVAGQGNDYGVTLL
jgi:hypothetical protein